MSPADTMWQLIPCGKPPNRYYGDNVWPESDELGVDGFEDAFKA
jgi:hypothetical protein